MKNISSLFLLLLCCFYSCQLDDESTNSNIENTTTAQSLLQASIAQMAFNQSAIGGRSAAVIMQYLEEADASIQNYKQYNLGNNYFNNMWSGGYYIGSLSSAKEMNRLAEEEGRDGLQAISMIISAHEYGVLTNMFGDIPYSEAGLGVDNNTPSYDTQEDVYTSIISVLDEAIALIGNNDIDANLSEDDLIYQGNLSLWKKLANGLKARYLLNLRNRDSQNDALILQLIADSFVSENEQADFQYNMDFTNPQYRFGDERPSTLISSDYLVNRLLTTADPRTDKYTIESDFYWDIFGQPEFRWYAADASIPILSYTELLFMKAELLHHMAASIPEISTALSEAIIQNMLDNNVSISDAGNYINEQSDVSGLSSDEILQRIIEQAYVAYYGYNHLQSWNNYRRTGYPTLTSTATVTNELNPSNIVPRRFLYPESELILNKENTEAAINRQDGALLDVDVWLWE